MFKIRNEYSEYITKTFRIPSEINDQLDKLSTLHKTSVNKVVIQCLEFALDNIEEDKPINGEEQI